MREIVTQFNNYQTAASDSWAGCFKVGAKIFFSKMEAMLYATQTKQDVTFHFHDDVFGKVNWQQPLNIPLNEMYRRRAQQLRDTYDYLVLHYSAGSDSHNILRTFIDNNIRLDEVFIRWPIEATKRFCPIATRDDDPHNVLSEWELTILPQIEWLKTHHPNIKITIKDISHVEMIDDFSDDDFLHASGGLYLNPGGFTKQVVTSETEVAMISRHQKVASIYGANKPCILKQGPDLYAFFMDYPARVGGGTGGGQLKNVELFYWTPSMPQLVVEQCHVVLNYYKNNPGLQMLIDKQQYKKESLSISAHDIMKALMYTNWDFDTFQVRKAGGWTWHNPYDNFIFRNYGNERFMQRWKSNVDNFIKSIDDRFKMKLNGKPAGLLPLTTKMYYIGKLF